MRGDSKSRRFWVGEIGVRVALLVVSSSSGGLKGSLVTRKFSAVQVSPSRIKRSAINPRRRTCPSLEFPVPIGDRVIELLSVCEGDRDTSELFKVPRSTAPEAFRSSPLTLP